MPALSAAGLPRESDQRKENEMPASQWNQRALDSQASKAHVKAQKAAKKYDDAHAMIDDRPSIPGSVNVCHQ